MSRGEKDRDKNEVGNMDSLPFLRRRFALQELPSSSAATMMSFQSVVSSASEAESDNDKNHLTERETCPSDAEGAQRKKVRTLRKRKAPCANIVDTEDEEVNEPKARRLPRNKQFTKKAETRRSSRIQNIQNGYASEVDIKPDLKALQAAMESSPDSERESTPEIRRTTRPRKQVVKDYHLCIDKARSGLMRKPKHITRSVASLMSAPERNKMGLGTLDKPLFVPDASGAEENNDVQCIGMLLRSRKVMPFKHQISQKSSRANRSGHESAPEGCNRSGDHKKRAGVEIKGANTKIKEELLGEAFEKMQISNIRVLRSGRTILSADEESDEDCVPPVKSAEKTKLTPKAAIESGYLSAPELRSLRPRKTQDSFADKPVEAKRDLRPRANRQEAAPLPANPAKQIVVKEEMMDQEQNSDAFLESSIAKDKPMTATNVRLPSTSSSAKENKGESPKKVHFGSTFMKDAIQDPEVEVVFESPRALRPRRNSATKISSTQGMGTSSHGITRINATVVENQINSHEKTSQGKEELLLDPFEEPVRLNSESARRTRSQMAELVVFPFSREGQLTPDSIEQAKEEQAKQQSPVECETNIRLTRSQKRHIEAETERPVDITSSLEPSTKQIKLETPSIDEGTNETNDDSEIVTLRVLRPRPVKEVVVVEDKRKQPVPKKLKEDLVDIKPDTVEDAKSNLVDRSLAKYTTQEYISQFEANVKLYRHLSNRQSRLFMKRNLLYHKTHIVKEDIKKHRIGEAEPPLLYKRLPKQRRTAEVDTHGRSIGLDHMIQTKFRLLRNKYAVHDKLGINCCIQFSLYDLAVAEAKGKSAGRDYLIKIYEGRNAYRALMEGKIPKPLPIENAINPVHTNSVLLTPSNSRESSVSSSDLIDSVVFTSCRHQTIPGKRVSWTQVYLAFEKKGGIGRPKKVMGAWFPLWVNGLNRSTIVLRELIPSYDKCYLFVEVSMTKTLEECKVEGHSLRARRGAAAEEPPKKKKKICYDFPDFDGDQLETSFYGVALYHDMERGYNLGHVDIELIEEDKLRLKNKDKKGFVQELLNEIKKNNTNPFLTTETRRIRVEDMSGTDDSDEETEPEVEIPKKVEAHTTKKAAARRQPAKSDSRIPRAAYPQSVFDAFTGKFKWNNKGQYVNDKEMIKFLFQDDRILTDERKMDMINSWMPLAIPKNLKYRFLCYTEPEASGDELDLFPSKKKCSVIQFKRVNWVVTDESTAAGQCIFCGRNFNNTFTLMLHYNTSYPRFAFVFSIRERVFKKAEDPLEGVSVFIDILLDPYHIELNEVFPMRKEKPIRRRVTPPRFFVVKTMVACLRKAMRMDNTLFARFLNVPELVDETNRFVSRFIDTDSGVPIAMGETVCYDTKIIPQPAYEMLTMKQLRIIQDYIDIDQTTKNFMCTWNKIMMAIGRYNQAILGAYLQHRLFIYAFWHVMNTEEGWRKRMCTQLLEYADTGILSSEETHDLWQRTFHHNYNPLTDRLSSIYLSVLDHVAARHRTMRRAIKRGKIPGKQAYHKCYRKDPRKYTPEQQDKLVAYCFWHSKAIPKSDTRRLLMVDPLDRLTSKVNDKRQMKIFFECMEPIILSEGEFHY